MLSTAYTGSMSDSPSRSGTASGLKVDKSRTAYVDPYGSGDAAGNYRKQSRPLVNKPRPEGKFGEKSPFGVDPVNQNATLSRFTTSANSVGGNKKDRIVPYAMVESRPSDSVISKAASGALVAAGQRPKIPTGPRTLYG